MDIEAKWDACMAKAGPVLRLQFAKWLESFEHMMEKEPSEETVRQWLKSIGAPDDEERAKVAMAFYPLCKSDPKFMKLVLLLVRDPNES